MEQLWIRSEYYVASKKVSHRYIYGTFSACAVFSFTLTDSSWETDATKSDLLRAHDKKPKNGGRYFDPYRAR